ncbi:MAG: septum formation inhibitor Maf [Magnetococcales bacterium]|nr:septum formation inhibitor Maf [Magnetococcales bacterium]
MSHRAHTSNLGTPLEAVSRLPWQGKKVRLVSNSPRRLALLRQVGIDPEVCPVTIDEEPRPDETPEHYVARLAQEKVERALQPGADFALGADTTVVVDATILGKPVDPEQARSMLARLSGRSHRVLTAIALCRLHDRLLRTRVVATTVWFKTLTPEEIATYVASGEPMDKAGAYALQGIGAFMVERIEGSCSGVIGLPLMETLDLLATLCTMEEKNLTQGAV